MHALFRAAGRSGRSPRLLPPRWSGRRAGLLVGVLAVGIGLLVSCDSSVSTNRPLSKKGVSADSTTVKYAHMPTGMSLPEPGSGPRGTLRAYRAAGGRKSKSGPAASPYGCYLASRPYSEAVRFRSVYLYFPEAMVEAAGEETKPLTFRLDAVRRGRTDTTGVRYAHCVIPDADGAEAIARRQVIREGEEQALTEAVQSTGQSAGAKSDCRDIVKVVEYCDYGGCTVVSVSVTVVCGGGGDGGSDGGDGGSGGGSEGGTTDPYPDDDASGGGGGGDDSGGGTGEECTAIDPEPGSDCEPVESQPPEDLCVGDPVIDPEIRPIPNSGVEGGRYGPDARGEGEEHWGIDIKSDVGDPLYSMTGGRVWATKNDVPPGETDGNPLGNYVIVEMANPDGEATHVLYAHLNEVSVGGEEVIRPGQRVGRTGKTGNARGVDIPHVHIETRKNDASKWTNFSHFDPEEQGIFASSFDQDGKPENPGTCQ